MYRYHMNTFVLVSLVAALLVGIAISAYALTYTTSGVRGQVDLHNQNNTSTNIVAATGQWNIAYKDVQTAQSNLALTKSQYGNGQPDPQDFMYTSTEACNDAVNTYNTLQNEPLTKGHKPASLPMSFDPTTTCK